MQSIAYFILAIIRREFHQHKDNSFLWETQACSNIQIHTLCIYKTVETVLIITHTHTLKHMFRDRYKEKTSAPKHLASWTTFFVSNPQILCLGRWGKVKKTWHVFKATRLINHPQLMSNWKWNSACNHTEPWLRASAHVCEAARVCARAGQSPSK